MAVLGDLKVIIDGDASGAQRSFHQAAQALAKLEGEIDKFEAEIKSQNRALLAAEKAQQSLSRAVNQTAETHAKAAAGWAKEIAIFQRYRAALYLVAEGFQRVYKVAEEGARTATAAEYFRNAGKSLEEYRTATKGLISDADLMKKANLADTMGLSGDTFKTLANVAHAAAAKTGQSYQHMLDSIILGTARESRLLLDNLGIIINATDARKRYAKELKESAEGQKYSALTVEQLANALTDAGEKAAFFAEVARTGQGALLEQAAVGETAADNFDRFGAAIDNLKTAIGKLIAEGSDSALAKMATLITSIADDLDRIGRVGLVRKGSVLDFVATPINAAAEWAGSQGVDWGDVLQTVVGGPAGAIGGRAGKALGAEIAQGPRANEQALLEELDVLTEKLHYAGEDIDGFAYALSDVPDLAALIEKFPDDALNKMGTETVTVVRRLKELGDQLGIVWKRASVGNQTGPGSGGVLDEEKLKRQQEEANEKWKRALEKREKAEREHIERVLKHEKEWFDKEMALRKANAEKLFDLYTRLLPNPAKRMARAMEMGMGVGDYEQRSADERDREDRRREQQQQATAGVEQTHSVISAAMSGSASALGAAIGGFFGPLGTAIGSLIGELLDPLEPVIDLLGHLASGIKGLLQLGLNPFLETLRPLGPALEIFLKAIGELIASSLAPLIPIMNLLITVVVLVIQGLSWAFIAFSPLIELVTALTQGITALVEVVWSVIDIIANLFGIDLLSFGQAMEYAIRNVETWSERIIHAAVLFHNGFVEIIRQIGRFFEDATGADFGLGDFGDMLSAEDFLPTPAIEENTDATADNTRAVEQLSRDLRNLPSGYKVNYALYGATAPVQQLPLLLPGQIAGRDRARLPPNFRWRT